MVNLLVSDALNTYHAEARKRSYQKVIPVVSALLTAVVIFGKRYARIQNSKLTLAAHSFASLLATFTIGWSALALYDRVRKKNAYTSTVTFEELTQKLVPLYEAYWTYLKAGNASKRKEDKVAQFLQNKSLNLSWPVSLREFRNTTQEFLLRRVDEFYRAKSSALLNKILHDGSHDFCQKEDYIAGSKIDVLGDLQGGAGGLMNYLKGLDIGSDFTLPKEAPHIVFLGNLVGAGFGYETWYIVMRLYIVNPGKITMIKGNQHLDNCNEIKFKYDREWPEGAAQKTNEHIINALDATLPAVYAARYEGHLCCFSHSVDPRARLDLEVNKTYTGLSYQDVSKRLFDRLALLEDVKINGKRELKLPLSLEHAGSVGMNKTHVHFKTEQGHVDLYLAAKGIVYLSHRIVGLWLGTLSGGDKVKNWILTAGPWKYNVKGMAHAKWGQTTITALDASFDDTEVRYRIPILSFEASGDRWAFTQGVVSDVFDYYKNESLIPKIKRKFNI